MGLATIKTRPALVRVGGLDLHPLDGIKLVGAALSGGARQRAWDTRRIGWRECSLMGCDWRPPSPGRRGPVSSGDADPTDRPAADWSKWWRRRVNRKEAAHASRAPGKI